MSLIVPNVGELYLLRQYILGIGPANLVVRLYQNNYTPVDTSILSNFTVATFSGYAQDVVSLATPTEVSNKAKTVGTGPNVFTHNGGGTANTIYGYYIVDDVTAELVWAERFGSSQTMMNNGDQISITLALTYDSENH